MKRFFQASCHEDFAHLEIKIKLYGHIFEPEDFDIQIMDENVLNVKAQDSEKKIDRKFKLPHNSLIQKIQSKFDVSKEENTQTLLISIPKEVFKKS